MHAPYFELSLLKKNIEILPTDTSLDDVLHDYGAEGDAWVDTKLTNVVSTPLTVIPDMIKQASSNYAAGRYLMRVKNFEGAKVLMEAAEKQVADYVASQSAELQHITMKVSAYKTSPLADE